MKVSKQAAVKGSSKSVPKTLECMFKRVEAGSGEKVSAM